VPEKAEALPVSGWAAYKKVSGVLLARVPLDGRTALYPRLGDWLPWGCWLVLVPLWFVARRRAREVVTE
jgi:apolipoprotein N-acyltransferase